MGEERVVEIYRNNWQDGQWIRQISITLSEHSPNKVVFFMSAAASTDDGIQGFESEFCIPDYDVVCMTDRLNELCATWEEALDDSH